MIFRDYADFVQDILDAVNVINRSIANKTFEEFKNTETIYFTVERMLEIIEEAANRIPAVIQGDYKEIPWAKMTAMRNRIIHAYDKVNPDIVWDTINNVIPDIIEPLNKMLIEIENK